MAWRIVEEDRLEKTLETMWQEGYETTVLDEDDVKAIYEDLKEAVEGD